MVFKSLNKNTSGGAVTDEIIPKQQLAEYLHKPIFRKFEKLESTFFKNSISGKVTIIFD